MENKCLKCGCEISKDESICKDCTELTEQECEVEIIEPIDEFDVSHVDLPSTEIYINYLNIEVDGEVVGNNTLQTLTEEQKAKVEELKLKKEQRLQKEKNIKEVKFVFKILWITFFGVFISFYLALFGVIECFSLFGIPFGIVLFKAIPLGFNPIGKRVKLNFYKRPFFNLIWLLFGGWAIASLYEIFVFLCMLTIIGIPFGLEMQKIGKLLWCPFGAQILKEEEFSDTIVEKEAYTVQYIRRNRIVIDTSNIDLKDREKEYIEKIYKVEEPVNQLFLKKGAVAKIALGFVVGLIVLSILKNNFAILFDLVLFAITKGVEPTGVLAVLRAIVNFSLINFIIGIFTKIFSPLEIQLTSYLSNIPYFNAFKIYIPLVILLLIIGIIVFIIIKVNNKKQAQKDEIDYGYATKKQLITYYDKGNKINPDVEDALVKIYVEYKVDVEKEIQMDKEA